MSANDDDATPTADPASVTGRVLEMRRAFDDTFAAPRLAPVSDVEKVILIEVGPLKLACRVGQITRLEADRKIVPVSGGAPGLVGLAGIRGKLVPVYALSVLLGAAGVGVPRWLALCGDADPCALAFDRLDQFVRARRTDVYPLEGAGTAPRHVKELLRLDSAAYHLLDIDSIVASIRGQGADDAAGA